MITYDYYHKSTNTFRDALKDTYMYEKGLKLCPYCSLWYWKGCPCWNINKKRLEKINNEQIWFNRNAKH